MIALRTGDPERIGGYTTLGRLGNGAMGTVFLARSPGGRRVAVKVVRTELADDHDFRERFRQEVAAMRAVGGFWTAAIVDADPDAQVPWLASEYVPGPTLQAAVAAGGPLDLPRAHTLGAGLAEALRAVHGTGLVHRDLKPANVLLTDDGPRVIDFGIARTLEGAGLTATGMVVGTPSFLSPEQIEGHDVTPAADVFALGAVLVYATTGDGPFGSGTVPALVYRVVHGEPNLAGVPDELRPLVARCLDRAPEARPTPSELLAELGEPAEWVPRAVPVTEFARPVEVRRPTKVLDPSAPSPSSSPSPSPSPEPEAEPTGAIAFRTRGRVVAAVSLAILGPCAVLFGTAFAIGLTSGEVPAAALSVALCVSFAVPALREVWRLVRPRRWLELSEDGLTVGRGKRSRQLSWSDVARARVVEEGRRPWLVVTLRAGVSRSRLRKAANGGARVYPVGHFRGRRARDRELRELRAALGWYGRTAYDPSP